MAAATDVREWKIRNRLIASGLVWGFALRALAEGSAGVVHFMVNVSLPVVLLYLFFQMRVLGAGDIKLFSLCGAFLTTRQLLALIPASFVAAAVLGAAKLACLKAATGRFGTGRTRIHFSIAILASYLLLSWRWFFG